MASENQEGTLLSQIVLAKYQSVATIFDHTVQIRYITKQEIQQLPY